MRRIHLAVPIGLLLVALALAGCGGGSGESPSSRVADPVVRVSHNWRFAEHHADGSTVDVGPVGSSTDQQVQAVDDMGKVVIFPIFGGNTEAIAEAFATAAGDTYWVATQAPSNDVTKPSSVIGSFVYLDQIQTFRKTGDAATMDLVVSEATLEAIDSNPHLPTRVECPHLPLLLPGPGTIAVDCGNLIDANLNYQIFAWKEVPIKDTNGTVTGFGKVDLAHGSVFAHLFGYLKDSTASLFFAPWHFDVGPSGDSTLRLKAPPDFFYSDNLEGGSDKTHALAALNRPTIIQIPLDAVDKDEEFKVVVVVTADVNNRRQLESYVSARFRDPQKLNGIAYQSQGVELVAVPVKTISTPPPPEVQPAPSCPTGSDPASGRLQFQLASVYAPEVSTLGSFAVWIARSGGSKGEVTLRFATQDGTARAGTDYQAVSTLVRFADGEEGRRFVAVPIVDNKVIDGARTVTLTLSDVQGCATLGSLSTSLMTILDDDQPAPTTAFALGGTVSGLAGSGLALRTTSGEQVQPLDNGSFAFDTRLLDGLSYSVTVATQPANPIQICTVTNGSGTIAGADVTNIAVNCAAPRPNGALDPSFGSGGKVATGIAGAPSTMALQSDGRIVMLGGLKLLRFNSDGTPDTSFGVAGQVTVPFNNSVFDTALGLAVQSDGRIVVVGFTSIGGQDDFALARFNTDGTLDTGFGSGGKVSTDFAGSGDQARRVVIQSDGKLVVAGYATTGTGASADADYAVARYNVDGTLDTSFGSAGKARTNIAGKFDFAQGIALQGDGKIVLVGRAGVDGGSDPDFGVVRYNANGTLDLGFGSDGVVRTDFGLGNWEEANDVAVQADGRIVVVGRVRAGAVFDFALARFNADGTLDAGFGGTGLVTTAFGTQADVAKALAIQGDGKIVVVGQGGGLSTNPDMAIARFGVDGSPDAGFGTAGRLTVDFFGAADGAEAVAVQGDGKIVVGGFARNAGTTGFALARLAP